MFTMTIDIIRRSSNASFDYTKSAVIAECAKEGIKVEPHRNPEATALMQCVLSGMTSHELFLEVDKFRAACTRAAKRGKVAYLISQMNGEDIARNPRG